MRAPRSDPQRERVYKMEADTIGGCAWNALPPKLIRQMIKALSVHYGTGPLHVRFKKLKHAGEWNEPNELVFSTYKGVKTSANIICHEFAHFLHWTLASGAGHQGHGPEFMACYLSVLDTARLIPMAAMKTVCDRFRVKYTDFGKDPQNLARLQRAISSSPNRRHRHK